MLTFDASLVGDYRVRVEQNLQENYSLTLDRARHLSDLISKAASTLS